MFFKAKVFQQFLEGLRTIQRLVTISPEVASGEVGFVKERVRLWQATEGVLPFTEQGQPQPRQCACI